MVAGHSLGGDVRFVLVTQASMMRDLDDALLSLDDLRVPCVAEINVYHAASSSQLDPELVSLKVREYAPRAHQKFTITKPFVRLPE
jgi:hypothetical protein